jgi:hypothetical protein
MPVEILDLAPLLQVFDMTSAARFYRDTRGLEVVKTDSKPARHSDCGNAPTQ